MRLLNSRTLEFHECDPASTKYAILSHTWGDDEVTYKQMRKQRAVAESMAGFEKIRLCAKQAVEDGLDYFWIDTCCINKSSSAELSEAINSMYKWYKGAQVCYAYLSDTPHRPIAALDSYIERMRDFKGARWFTRGWTLQELIAPPSLKFYYKDWKEGGTREMLARSLQDVTGIPASVLETGDFSGTSLARRMSWAAGRTTSRPEDLAYSLLGLFDINMPLLYGEGENAFIRLQEEIIKNSDDMSIFAWTESSAKFSAYRGLLAKSPSDFSKCKNIWWDRANATPPYQSTNKGISITLPLEARTGRPEEYIALLQGVRKGEGQVFPQGQGIFLRKIGSNQYARIEPQQLAPISLPGGPDLATLPDTYAATDLFVRQKVLLESGDHSSAAGILIRVNPHTFQLDEAHPTENWDLQKMFFSFSQPPAVKIPPPALIKFRILTSRNPGTIAMTLDLTKPWGDWLAVDPEWWRRAKSTTSTSLMQEVCCEKAGLSPGLSLVQIKLHRDLVAQESTIILEAAHEQRQTLRYSRGRQVSRMNEE